MAGCECHRVVRLDLPSGEIAWICNQCNAQYIPQAAVRYKIESLAGTLMTLIERGELTDEQVKRVWKQEGLSV